MADDLDGWEVGGKKTGGKDYGRDNRFLETGLQAIAAKQCVEQLDRADTRVETCRAVYWRKGHQTVARTAR